MSKSKVVCIRFSPEEVTAIDQRRGSQSVSDFVRHSLWATERCEATHGRVLRRIAGLVYHQPYGATVTTSFQGAADIALAALATQALQEQSDG